MRGPLRVVLIAAVAVPLVASGGPVGATAPGRNGRIAYVVGDVVGRFATPTSNIFTVRPDGTGRRNLTPGPPLFKPGYQFAESPDWSTDGRRIAYRVWGEFAEGCIILAMRRDGTGKRPITERGSEVCDDDPAWSPDGHRIAFSRAGRTGGWADIYIVAVSTGAVRRVTRHPSDESGPQWSPDGRSLVFTRSGLHRQAIYVITIGDGRVDRITPFHLSARTPDWSPNGRRIMFTGTTGGRRTDNVFTVNPDGSGMKQVTFQRGPGTATRSGTWSPNGQRMVVEHSSGRFRDSGLFVIQAGGGKPRRVAGGRAIESDWGPRLAELPQGPHRGR